MVQKVSSFEGKPDSGFLHSPYHDGKRWKILKPSERTKLQNMCKEKVKNFKVFCKLEGAQDAPSVKTCQSTVLKHNQTGEQRPETTPLLSPLENVGSESGFSGGPRPEGIATESAPVASTSEYHVLAVDDSMVDRKVIERLLKTSSYKVTIVNSALRALEFLGLSESCTPSMQTNRVSVNLIMTDYCMPGMTGYDLLKIVKAETSALKEVPVIVMSSENDSSRIQRCLAEGAEEFLIKPVQMEDVKRLQGHIRPCVSSGRSESSNSSSCAKRKVGTPDGLEPTSPVRRARYSGLVVA